MRSVFQKTWIKNILIIIIVLSVGIYFRLYPLHSYSPSDSSEKASLFVLAKIKDQIAKQLVAQNPHIDPLKLNILIQKNFNEVLHQDSKKIQALIAQIASTIKIPDAKRTFPYLLESDSFYYYNLTENILKTGKIAETIQGSKYLNRLMLAPEGHWEPLTLHPYVGFTIYKFLSFFNPKIDLMYAVSFTSVFVASLSLMVFIWVCRLLGTGTLATGVGSFFYFLAPIFVKRSTFGWYDNDPYTPLFILLILGFYFLGLKSISNIKASFRIALILAFLIALYSLFWQGWVFIFSVLVGASGIILLFQSLNKKSLVKSLLVFFALSFASAFLLITVIFGPREFFVLFQEGLTALSNFIHPQLALWPDLYISVGELRTASWQFIIELTGGYFFFAIAILGFIYSLYCLIRDRKNPDSSAYILLIIFFWVSLFLTLGAQRFAVIAFIPLALMFVLGLNAIRIVSHQIFLKTNSSIFLRITYYAVSMAIILTVLIPVAHIRASISYLLNPIFNETWESALTQIRRLTPEDSIVTTWWPPGHFIKAVAQRRVNFDGATINVPQGYWIANFFLSENETEALGILRMLNNSANAATEYLHGQSGFPLSSSVNIIKTIIALNESDARKVLEKNLKDNRDIDHILTLTHRSSPPSYCLLYNEFVEGGYIQLPFVANWNFKKIEDINTSPELLKTVPVRKSKQFIDFLWSLAGGTYRYSGVLPELSRKGNIVIFANNLQVNVADMNGRLDSPEYGRGIPYSIFYDSNNEMTEHRLSGSNLTYSIILIKDGGRYTAILLDRPLARSMLVRLFFFDGKGLKYFDPLVKKSDLTKRTEIKIFKVNWEKFEDDLKGGLRH